VSEPAQGAVAQLKQSLDDFMAADPSNHYAITLVGHSNAPQVDHSSLVNLSSFGFRVSDFRRMPAAFCSTPPPRAVTFPPSHPEVNYG